jgi:hypothetical protein
MASLAVAYKSVASQPSLGFGKGDNLDVSSIEIEVKIV